MLLPVVILDYSGMYACLEKVVSIYREIHTHTQSDRVVGIYLHKSVSRGSVDLTGHVSGKELGLLEVIQVYSTWDCANNRSD